MKSKYRRIMREQLDNTFKQLAKFKILQPPVKGWLRSIRESLGISGKQLGKRVGVSQPRIVQMEKDELTGAITINTMRQVAEAMDCVFVYAIIPTKSLETTLHEQAHKVAEKQLSRTAHSMLLEDQLVLKDDYKKMLHSKTDELVREMPRHLWIEE